MKTKLTSYQKLKSENKILAEDIRELVFWPDSEKSSLIKYRWTIAKDMEDWSIGRDYKAKGPGVLSMIKTK